jgi:catechol 1,2-dioxygenase
MGSKVESGSLGSEFTQMVVNSMGPNTPPRLREIMSSLIRHLHEFTIETQLTTDEWMIGVNAINLAGKMSDDKRNEGQLMCDIIGLES